MKKYIKVVFILVSAISNAYSQNDYTTIHPSANIGWGIANLSSSNDLYTGSVRLSIPIYEINSGAVKLPINLGYTTKSIPVDQLPSWVGIGWNLNIGGQISRTVNGKPDEMRDTKPHSITTVYVSPYGAAFDIYARSSAGELTQSDFAYLVNYNRLNTTQWADATYLQNTLGQMPYVEVDRNEYVYITQGSQTVQANPIAYYTYSYDFEPDIFHFSVGNLSGSFFLNQEGKWVCETNQGNYKIEPLMATDIAKGGIKIARAIYGFILTAPDGVRYLFGGTTGDYLKNNEFWRGPSNIGEMDSFNAFPYFAGYVNACPSTWYLTRIETPNNQFVDFTYKKGALQVQYSEAPSATGGPTGFHTNQPGYIQQSLFEPWYLTNIKCSNGIEVAVNSANSQQLGTDVRIDNLCPYTAFTSSDVSAVIREAKNTFLKVTSIQIKDNGEVKKTFSFDYIENINERLKLKSVNEVSRDNNVSNLLYSFDYYPGLLPAYSSGLVDHFGYFNNKKFFTDKTQKDFNLTRTEFETQYYNTREPVFTYSQYEVLHKIYFPGGGIREFLYEPHDYSAKINRWPFNVESLSVNQETGGVRVSKIVDYKRAGEKAGDVSFIYKRDINNPSSSGVFSIPAIKYTKDFNSSGAYEFEARSFTPFDRIKNYITYSTVIEKRSDNSYKKYDFWNYDNGANDDLPLFETANQAYNDGQTFTNYAFKRGLVKKLTAVDNAGQVVQLQTSSYQHEVDSYSRFLKAVRLSHNNSNGTGYKAAAYPYYYFPNFLRSENTELKNNDPVPSVVTSKNYEYDAKNNLIKIRINNSTGQQIETQYFYPYHFSTTDNNNPYTQLVNRNIVNLRVEEKQLLKKDGQDYLMNTTFFDFSAFNNGILKPRAVYKANLVEPVLLAGVASPSYQTGSLTVDARYNVYQQFNYNEKGSVIETQDIGAQKKSLIWGYNQKFPIAQVANAAVSQIAYTSFETDDYGGWNLNSGGTFLNNTIVTGKKTYTGGVTKTVPQGNYKVTLWAAGNAAVNEIAGTPLRVSKRDAAWRYFEWKLTNVSAIQVSADQMDEVRLYPEGAQMTTYTYEPLIGMTTHVDFNNNITYYTYDGFGRLSFISDEAYNVVKKYCYNYQGQVQECSAAPANWQPTGVLRCAKNTNDQNTGYQEREERDVESNSSTADQTRWVSVGENCTTCPRPQNWQPTGNVRCNISKTGENTGYQEREERNQESCSPTYGQARWSIMAENCTRCPRPQNWQPTGNYRCGKDGSGQNTGYQEREEMNQEKCSPGWKTFRWVSVGQNCTTCPKLPNWQTISTSCEVNSTGQNTGYQLIQQRNTEPCSPNYNGVQTISVYNPSTCPVPVPTIYARLSYENFYADYQADYADYQADYADVVVRFYSDAACTQPLNNPSGITLLYGVTNSCTGSYSDVAGANGNEVYLGNRVQVYYIGYYNCGPYGGCSYGECYTDYHLESSSQYTIVY